MLFAIQQHSAAIDVVLREEACVPTAPDGITLRRPRELVHPGSPVSSLYDEVDARFPQAPLFCETGVLVALERLGMRTKQVCIFAYSLSRLWLTIVMRIDSY